MLPIIILISVDDMGWSDLGCYRSEIKTPHDPLMARGFRPTFNYTINVTVPRGMIASNLGKLDSVVHTEFNTVYSFSNVKTAFRMDICVADYSILEYCDLNLRIHYFTDDSAGAKNIAVHYENAINYYTRLYGKILIYSDMSAPIPTPKTLKPSGFDRFPFTLFLPEQKYEHEENDGREDSRYIPDPGPVRKAVKSKHVDGPSGKPGPDKHSQAIGGKGNQSLCRTFQMIGCFFIHVDLPGHEEEIVAYPVKDDTGIDHGGDGKSTITESDLGGCKTQPFTQVRIKRYIPGSPDKILEEHQCGKLQPGFNLHDLWRFASS